MNNFSYSKTYQDDQYDYRNVALPSSRMFASITANTLLRESEWRKIGIHQASGWVNYAISPTKDILFFRKTKEGKDKSLGALERQLRPLYEFEESAILPQKNWQSDDLQKELGRGAYGTVFLVPDPHKRIYAVKRQYLVLKNGLNQSVLREIAILIRLSHPNIINPLAIDYLGFENLIGKHSAYSLIPCP